MDWTDWDSVNVSTFSGTSLGDVPFPFQYESSFMYEFGATRYFDNGYYLSAGYIYSENSVPDATFSPFNPDSNLHLGSIGVGKTGEKWDWALGYHFAYNGGRVVRNNIGSQFQNADGTWKTLNHGFNLSVTRRF